MGRVLMGMALALLAIVVLYAGGYILMGVLLLCLVVDLYEVQRATAKVATTVKLWPLMLFVVTTGIFVFYGDILGILLAFVVSVLAIYWEKILRGELDFPGIAYTLSILVYPGLFAAILFALATLEPPYNTLGVFMAVWYACMNDVFAFFVGILFGKHKLAPQVSPRKSWEGAAGGLFGGIAASVSLYFMQDWIWGISLPLLELLLLGLIATVAGSLGDLTASLVKRMAGIKDYSRLFLDHGGMMDRMDSVIAAAPVIYGYFLLFVMTR